ncbi:MAG: formylmethanofuran dehydrogenase subunit C [Polymorphobacter sp.]
MSRLTLTLKAHPDFALDMSAVIPAALIDKRLPQIRAIKLQHGRRRVALGDWFEIEGDTNPTELVIEASQAGLHRIGAGLTAGSSIEVRGDCGLETGLRMRGGVLRVSGHAGDGTGQGMRGGLIDIAGDTGDFAGGPAPGDVTGMKNGAIVVGGHLGARAGERMRRGLIAAGGNAGAYCGSQMVAGSIVVLGECGEGVGSGMCRGSIVLARPTSVPGRNFVRTGEFELAFLPLLISYLRELKPDWAPRLGKLARVSRWVGDAGNGGFGEILIAHRR